MAPLVTLITGCSSGIGLALAVKLAQDQDKNYLVYATMRNLAKQDDLVSAAGGALNDTLYIQELDVTKDDHVTAVCKDLIEKHGKIDILVSNAGLGFFAPFEAMTMEKAKEMFDINFFGSVRLLHAVLPCMKKHKSGRIIVNSSVLGHCAMPFTDMYNASKFAIEGLVESLQPQLRAFNISVSSIQPGPVTTKFSENMSSNQDPEEQVGKVDEDTMKQMIAFSQVMGPAAQNEMQQVGEVVEVFLECIQAKEPKLRYPTSDSVRQRFRERYTDEMGAAGAEMWYKMMQGPTTS